MKSGQGGRCPACGSFNVQVRKAESDQPEPPAKWRLILLVAVWAALLLMIIGKLVN